MILRRLVLHLPLLLAVTQCPQKSWAVDVGEAEDSASSCPNVTTVAIYGSSSNSTQAISSNVQITVASTCKTSVVKVSTTSEGVRTLDLRSRSIAAVQSLPAVDIVRLDNNQIRAFSVANNVSAVYLANNSIPTMDAFAFPSGLTLLDLANNALGDMDNAKLPSSLQYLNLSGNPIGSISDVSFPSSLLQLNVADSSVATLENFSFPGSVTTLNFSNNPITMIRGVIFPDSLTALTLIASAGPATTLTESVTTLEEARTLQDVGTDPAAQVVSVLEEFEVRQSDADVFEKVGHWDVSTTSTLSCSDSNANPRYVQDTMLCVLSDSEFATKYQSVVIEASSRSTSGSMWGTDSSSSQAAERIALEESLHQRRSWFLIGAAALLSAFTILMFVNAFCLCLQRKIRGPSKENSTRRGLEKTARGRSNYFWHENESLEPDDEVHRLLSSSPSTITNENSVQPEHEPAVTRAASAEEKENLSDPLALLTQELLRHEIHKSLIKHRELLTAERESIDNGPGENSSPFVYFKAVYHRKMVVMKVLLVSKLNGVKRGSDVSSGLLHFVEEIRLSSELTHPQLVAFYGFVKMTKPRQAQATEDEGVALVMEYMDKCDLNTFIQRHKQLLLHKQTARQQPQRKIQERTNSLVKHVGWDDAAQDDVISGDGSLDGYEEDVLQLEVSLVDDRSKWSWQISSDVYKSKLAIAIEVAQAVQYLHSFTPPLFHGNLSSRKVFLDSDWNVKLGDLTCCSALRRWSSSHKQHSTSSATTGSATRGSGRSTTSSQASGEEIHMDMSVWTAPEVLDGRQYTQKADIYSFGVLLTQLATYECSSAEHSVMDDTEVPMLNNSQKHHSADGEAPTPIRLLMFRCQAFQPEVRPTADELLQELQHIELELASA